MSNDASITVVKVHDKLYVDVVVGLLNFKPLYSKKPNSKEKESVENFIRPFEKNGVYNSLDEIQPVIYSVGQSYVQETGEPPEHEIVMIDLSHYFI